MQLVSTIRAILRRYKRQLLCSLFAAGCLTIGYFIIKDRTISISLSTFKKLLESQAVKEVIVKGNEVEFRTVLPEIFHVDITLVSTLELKRMVGSIPITSVGSTSVLEKYRDVAYGVLALTSALVTRITVKTAKMIGKAAMPKVKKLKNLKSKLLVKLHQIPKVMRSMKQVLMINFANRFILSEISLKINKRVVTVSKEDLMGKRFSFTNSIIYLKDLDPSSGNEELLASLQQVMNGTDNILVISGKSEISSLVEFSASPGRLDNVAKIPSMAYHPLKSKLLQKLLFWKQPICPMIQ